MNIIHYCSMCKHTSIARKHKDVLFCGKCKVGEKIDSIYEDREDEMQMSDMFDAYEVVEQEEEEYDTMQMSMQDILKSLG